MSAPVIMPASIAFRIRLMARSTLPRATGRGPERWRALRIAPQVPGEPRFKQRAEKLAEGDNEVSLDVAKEIGKLALCLHEA